MIEHLRPGLPALDSAGQRVGRVETFYRDPDREEPAFACVKTGRFGRRLSLVPLAGASVEDDGLRLAYGRRQIREAPPVQADSELAGEQLTGISEHYELSRPDGPGPTRLVRHDPATPPDSAEPDPDPVRARNPASVPGAPPAPAGEDDLLVRLDSLERRMRALERALD